MIQKIKLKLQKPGCLPYITFFLSLRPVVIFVYMWCTGLRLKNENKKNPDECDGGKKPKASQKRKPDACGEGAKPKAAPKKRKTT